MDCLHKDAPAGSAMTSPAASIARIARGAVGRPFVVAQLGQSLDGRIATASGESQYINGPRALDHLHRLRASVDAIVVGAGTVLADNPRLDVRRVAGGSPARVAIDPKGRVSGSAQFFRDDGIRRLVITGPGVTPRGPCEHIVLPLQDCAMAPAAIIAALDERGLPRLLVEGGARTISQFINARCVDRLHVLVSCMIIGSGQPGLELRPLERLCDALRMHTDVFLLGEGDVLFDCDLRTPRHDNLARHDGFEHNSQGRIISERV